MSVVRIIVFAAVVGLALSIPHRSEAARCLLVTGTATGSTKTVAVDRSRIGLEDGIADLKRQQGWKAVTSVSPRAAKPNPFFKGRAITPNLLLKPDVRSARAHSVCWTGVVAPAVCTTGAMVCGR